MSEYEVLVSSVQYVGGLSIGTLLTQLLKYTGAAKPDLAVLPFYLGLLISSFILMGRENKNKKPSNTVQLRNNAYSKGDDHFNPTLHVKQLVILAIFGMFRLSGTVFSIFAINNCGSATVSVQQRVHFVISFSNIYFLYNSINFWHHLYQPLAPCLII